MKKAFNTPKLLILVALIVYSARVVEAQKRIGASRPALSINDVSLAEDSCQNASFVFTVTLSKLTNKVVNIHYETSDGRPDHTGTAAVVNEDYVKVSGTLAFTHDMPPNGPKGSYLRTITVPLGNYVVSNGTNDARAFTVTLSGATNATIAKAQGVGTLLNAGSGCATSQNAKCYVNFCGTQTTCTNVNRSTTATPYCQLQSGEDFGACNAASLWRDNDGDGLSDAAEAQGFIDANANGVYDPGIDVPLPGADPHKPDVYIHYDYTYANNHDHNPPPQAIEWVVEAFLAHGVNLHIDPQHNAISESAARVVTLANPTDATCTGPSAVSVHQLRETFQNLKLLSPVYHYMVFGHYATCDPSVDPNTSQPYCNACPNDPETPLCGVISPQKPQPGNLGTAEVYGDDSIVATQGFTDVGLPPIPLEAWAGLAMHELGHNLGLEHGGNECFNYKPNYVSVMNYNFYTKGIPVGASPGDTVAKSCTTDTDCFTGDQPHATQHCSAVTGMCFRIDYSDRRFNQLDEPGTTTGIDEALGLLGGANDTDISWTFARGQWLEVPTNGSAIDFFPDGIVESNLIYDVNGDGQTTQLNTQNDWTQLQFAYQCQPTFASELTSRPNARERRAIQYLLEVRSGLFAWRGVW